MNKPRKPLASLQSAAAASRAFPGQRSERVLYGTESSQTQIKVWMTNMEKRHAT